MKIAEVPALLPYQATFFTHFPPTYYIGEKFVVLHGKAWNTSMGESLEDKYRNIQGSVEKSELKQMLCMI